MLEKAFEEQQTDLVKTHEDGSLFAQIQDNKIIQLVNKIKASHNGPITTLEQLEEVRSTYKDNLDQLDKILNLEIRFRKITLVKIKTGCPLFKQGNITQDLKIKNLQSLINDSLNCATTVEFEDLEEAILDHSRQNVDGIGELSQQVAEQTSIYIDVPQQAESSQQQFNAQGGIKQGQFVVALIDDENEFYVGEVAEVLQGMFKINFLTRVKKDRTGIGCSPQ